MMPAKTHDEIAACLEQMRWILSGCLAGGIPGWHHLPGAPARNGAPVASPPAPEDGEGLAALRDSLAGCKRCRLHSGRTNLVFGEGSTQSGLVFVGEGPGFEEDRRGRPFVGRAGKLLDKMIRAIGFSREQVYICNVVKCRPPENRTPQADEIEACSPFLRGQIELLRPRVICALGGCAAQVLAGNASPISRLRGKVHLWRGIPLICTFHPAYLLRNSSQKAAAWQDLREVLRVLGAGAKDRDGAPREAAGRGNSGPL